MKASWYKKCKKNISKKNTVRWCIPVELSRRGLLLFAARELLKPDQQKQMLEQTVDEEIFVQKLALETIVEEARSIIYSWTRIDEE